MSASEETRGPGLRIAKVHGVPVHIGVSWLFLAAVIILLWGTQFGGGLSGYLVGAGYAVALLVAVLAHETGHAVVARLRGLPVLRVVADLWGGHTAYDGRRGTPATAALVAIAGPAVNVVIGLACLLVGWVFLGPVPGMGAVTVFGVVNLLLAGFNLLPGLPLDGGQLVDAGVWGATGRRDLGLVVAGWCGRVLAIGVLAWAFVLPLLRGASPDLTLVWMAFVAAFLWQGASSAIRTGRARGSLAAVRVGEVTSPAVLLPPQTPLGIALEQGRAVVTSDAQGRPTLVLVQAPDQADLAGLDPSIPLAAVVTRFPDGAVVETDPHADVTDLVIAIQETRWPHLVLTHEGSVVGVTDAATIDAVVGAAEQATGRAR